jgi:hypothetical protein
MPCAAPDAYPEGAHPVTHVVAQPVYYLVALHNAVALQQGRFHNRTLPLTLKNA